MNELTEVTECAFLNAIQNLVRHSVLEKIEAPSPDLMPTAGIGYLLNFMSEILSVAALNEGRKEFVSKVRYSVSKYDSRKDQIGGLLSHCFRLSIAF